MFCLFVSALLCIKVRLDLWLQLPTTVLLHFAITLFLLQDARATAQLFGLLLTGSTGQRMASRNGLA